MLYMLYIQPLVGRDHIDVQFHQIVIKFVIKFVFKFGSFWEYIFYYL
jgi:hypothetical protein